tara:strand:- start:607 stop:717 length:111 start_codon:yes stop_codon:yes gene_type:complete
MDELLKLLIGLIFFSVLAFFAWESTKMVDDKNRRNK